MKKKSILTVLFLTFGLCLSTASFANEPPPPPPSTPPPTEPSPTEPSEPTPETEDSIPGYENCFIRGIIECHWMM